MKGKTLHIFVRFGGVDLKNQKGYKADASKQKSYHSPPAPRGFYAMPKVAQEFFLISGMSSYQPGTVPNYPKKKIVGEDENGIPICGDITQEQWDDHQKRYDKAISAMRKEFSRKDGNVWHHLEEWTDQNEIIGRHGSWVKTSIQAWKKAFTKMSLNNRYGEKRFSGWDLSTKSINEPLRSGLMGMYSKDHCEVFFDEKV